MALTRTAFLSTDWFENTANPTDQAFDPDGGELLVLCTASGQNTNKYASGFPKFNGDGLSLVQWNTYDSRSALVHELENPDNGEYNLEIDQSDGTDDCAICALAFSQVVSGGLTNWTTMDYGGGTNTYSLTNCTTGSRVYLFVVSRQGTFNLDSSGWTELAQEQVSDSLGPRYALYESDAVASDGTVSCQVSRGATGRDVAAIMFEVPEGEAIASGLVGADCWMM